ncbi:hypothetical protein BDY17DRAFT_248506 [Neohortaea acidophila]|uniref:Calcium-transporting ATPase n=1 Tax=Neohortaea acidophila TaxID=245834 RepID=A0A6A6PWF3_9PEZI|nr:uncharacterized protein BDY17DRAFT_248506 [Neohortaea acidophila]KAF2484372.1 hypothetical protein BDY17DRAFT_248506 [Neohortaea acidophila]
MADPQPPPSAGSKDSHSPGPARRPRAPTITIDTSAVRRSLSNRSRDPEHEMDNLSDDGRSSHGDKSPMLKPTTPTELRVRNSFDSRDSRPTSPHNISSPTQWNNPHNFLAVPTPRSRGASIDTDASADTTSASDVTYVNTQPSESPIKSYPSQAFGQERGEQVVLPASEALHPDQGTEADFQRENNPFAFTPGQLGKLYNPKSLGAFHALGGLAGLEKGLRTDRSTGLSMDESKVEGRVTFEDATTVSSPASANTAVEEPEIVNTQTSTAAGSGNFADRKRIFGDNTLPQRKPKSFLQLIWLAYNDKVLIVLTVAAVIALSLGIYQALVPPYGVEWIEGVAIIVAIIVVVFVGAVNDWQKERQFAKLNAKKDSRDVKVVRSGKIQEINIVDVLVGDVLMVEPGDILPVDGIFITGHDVRCDESSATGESDVLRKVPADTVYQAVESNESLKKMDPFMISGGKVTEGFGRMIVTATGIQSSHGKTMLSLQDDNEATPLQHKLNGLAEYIAKIGSAAALLLFIVLFIKFAAQLPHNHRTPTEKGQEFLTILITAVTIVVVAVPEGLPLAVTLALAYATKRMLKDRNLVRVLRSCETMGNATTVCSDKTGTLTQNVMTVVAGAIGTSNRFSSTAKSNAGDMGTPADHLDDVPAPEFVKTLAQDVKDLWRESIAINSTAFESEPGAAQRFVGSKTETALLDFARDYLAMEHVTVERDTAEIAQMIPFDSSRKCMGMVYKRKDGKGYRLVVKGASEIMLKYCTQLLRDPTTGTETCAFTGDIRKTIAALIDAYANRSLRTIGFIYRDFDTASWPPKGVKRLEDDQSQAAFSDLCTNTTFLGLVGIQDPLRPGVPEAVQDMLKAGVFPRMVTGDNILTAKAIATECGIFTAGGIALEGPEFRKMSDAEQRSIIPKLQVLARSSPDDKRKLVKRLKEMGETVAVTGDGTNDAPALKAADVGFSMNIAGTEVAKEASDIILMDDNFTSIVLALMWGRAVNDAVRKFLQFQITVNITAVTLAFISAVSNENEESVLSAVQLLWVNLIMDTMAALALATDPPTRTILNRKPDPKSAPLISTTMWKMIIGQAVYQLAVTFTLYFAGASILNKTGEHGNRELRTLVFNTFVWMQIFNAINNRRLDNRFNIFEGILRNWFFIGIFCIMVGAQIIIIFFGGWAAFQAYHQTPSDWGIAIVLGIISIPIGVVVRLVPDELAAKVVPQFIKTRLARKREKVLLNDEESPFEMNQALLDIRDELAWIKKYKGGRLRGLKFAMQNPKEMFHSRSPSRSRASSSLPRTPNNELADDDGKSDAGAQLTPESAKPRRSRGRSRSNSALAGAAMAGIVAGSIAAGWSPIERREGEDDSVRFTRPQRSKSDLSREVRIDAHPDTSPHDPVVVAGDPVEAAGGQPPSQANATTPQLGVGPFGGAPAMDTADKKEEGKA